MRVNCWLHRNLFAIASSVFAEKREKNDAEKSFCLCKIELTFISQANLKGTFVKSLTFWGREPETKLVACKLPKKNPTQRFFFKIWFSCHYHFMLASTSAFPPPSHLISHARHTFARRTISNQHLRKRQNRLTRAWKHLRKKPKTLFPSAVFCAQYFRTLMETWLLAWITLLFFPLVV